MCFDVEIARTWRESGYAATTKPSLARRVAPQPTMRRAAPRLEATPRLVRRDASRLTATSRDDGHENPPTAGHESAQASRRSTKRLTRRSRMNRCRYGSGKANAHAGFSPRLLSLHITAPIRPFATHTEPMSVSAIAEGIHCGLLAERHCRFWLRNARCSVCDCRCY